jgi:hypothetical protein
VDQIRVAQQQDPVLGPLVQLRQQHDYNPATDRFRDLYVLLDDMLVVAELDRTRIVVPSGSIKQKLLKLYHDCSGHQGTTRTLWALEQGFFWPNMGREVKRYCASCPLCQASNAARLRPPGFSQPHPIPSVPGAAWSVDFIELPETKTGLNCCCVWTDRLTKYAIICPLRMSRNDPLTARATAECFMQRVYLQFGCPLDITSDRGPQFVSQVWSDIWQQLGTTVHLTTAYTPHSNGNAERQNRIINKLLRISLNGVNNDWERLIPMIQFELNNNFVTSLGMSPSQALMGFDPRRPWSPITFSSRPSTDSTDFLTFHSTLHQSARDSLRTAQLQLIDSLDAHRDSSYTFAVGDFAWIRSDQFPFPGGKHSVLPWMGPFEVLAVNPSSVALKLPDHWRVTSNVFHVSKLKKDVSRPVDLGVINPPPIPILVDGTLRYEVDQIIDHRRFGKRKLLQYRVRWTGYDQSGDTWEYATNLRDDGLMDMIRAYHDRRGVPLEPF